MYEVRRIILPRTRVHRGRAPLSPEKLAWVIYSRQGDSFRKEEESTMREDQSVAEMANEVLMRQAKVRADRTGEPIEEAMEVVLDTEAGKQLRELRDGPHSEEGVEETQLDAARERARERVEDLGKRLGKAPGHPAHG
jgi:hypothetical protein